MRRSRKIEADASPALDDMDRLRPEGVASPVAGSA
jgi:hypothetical protein